MKNNMDNGKGISMTKREEFELLAKKKRSSNFIVIILTILIGVGGTGIFIAKTKSEIPRTRYSGGTYNIGKDIKYESEIGMTKIKPMIIDAQNLAISLEDLISNKLIYTEYRNGRIRLPLMSYLSPSGRVVLTFSFCEPCRSETFRINGFGNDKRLVCETCNTNWRLSDLRGVFGGCVDYPPEEIPYTVKEGQIIVSTKILEEWVPREVLEFIDM